MNIYLVYNLETYEDRDVAHVCQNYDKALEYEYKIFCEQFERYSIDDLHNYYYSYDMDLMMMYLDYEYFKSDFKHDIEEWEVE